MDPLTIVVTALALGAKEAISETAKSFVHDTYSALKALILRRYQQVDLRPIETRPESKAKQDSLLEDLEAAGAVGDSELDAAAEAVISAVKRENPAIAQALGVDLANVEAAALRIKSVRSTGTGVHIADSRFSEDIEIGDVVAGVENSVPQTR